MTQVAVLAAAKNTFVAPENNSGAIIYIMPKTAQSEFYTCLEQAQQLVKSANWSALERYVPTMLRLAQNLYQYQSLYALLKPVKNNMNKPLHYADLLLSVREFNQAKKELEPWLDLPESLPLYALALLRTNLPSTALEYAHKALEYNQRPELAHRVIAEASFELKLDWKTAFEQALKATSKRQRGFVYIEYGRCFERMLEHASAQECWAEALLQFCKDSYYLALILGNLGLSCVRQGKLEEAETHYAKIKALPKIPHNNFDWQSWRGLGLMRRAAGEYERALYAYRLAERRATEPFETVQALRGIGHTQRLQRHSSLALTTLVQALKLQKEHGLSTQIEPDLAAALLANGNVEKARNTLLSWQGSGEDHERSLIVIAELARIDQNSSLALEYARGVNWHSLWGREELSAFPKLRALLDGMDWQLPELIVPQNKFHVRVQARGIVQVFVNQRRIELGSTSQAAQVLVVLLEHGGSCSGRELLELIYPNTPNPQTRSKLKLVSKAVVILRQKLGWEKSIEENGGAYQLDVDATWDYDINKARASGEKVSVFMSGVDADWVEQQRRDFADQPRVLN